ncbi:competence protein CoiA [Halalkalibacter nanhaiisediminis]|uniref:Competence CoiA-like predicted nuclease n=1 Tax=Halalkalibacter nanhaiisediminis TaxID=688079 RepID=A0A562Q960_9BACI|nr:competence protein CoiA family protein [Halalkalibacter nanhaiisediminis]TWI53292.1 competence CoiA-like predicted nuclease [Halalkalibacter nanhaiisediminis]
MFNAMFEDGTIISVVDRWHLDELKELRKKRSFYCQMCKGTVQLKLGTKKQWHFAHQANFECDFMIERETIYHMNGKKQLYEWLKSQKLEVALEVYLPIIRQRPDLLLRYKQTLYALEFQCAPIDPDLLAKRTNGYLQLGITPIWILGGNRLKRYGPKTFSLKTFEWYATRSTHNDGHFLTYYCPKQKSLALLQQLTPYSATKILANYQEHPLQSLTLENLLHAPAQTELPIDEWLSIKKHWRYKHPTPYPSKTDRFLQQLLYRKQIPTSLFPIEAGWPTNYHYLIESPSYQWQTFLILECLQYQPLHHSFSSQIVKKCLQPYMHRGLFGHRKTFNNLDWSIAVDGFLLWLTQIGYLEKTNSEKEQFKRKRNIVIPSSIEQAFEFDRKYLCHSWPSKNKIFDSRHNKGVKGEKVNV